MSLDERAKDGEMEEPAKEERSPIFERRLERATELKEQGNEKFREGAWREALELYERGLYHGEFDETQYNFELMDPHRAQVDETCAPLQLNAAACCLRLGEPRRAIELCTKVLEKDAKNAKALFRRGQGQQALGNLEKAKDDLVKAAHAAPQDKGVRKALAEVVASLKAENVAARKLWAGKMQQTSSPTGPAETFSNRDSSSTSTSSPSSSSLSSSAMGRGACQRFVDSILSWLGFSSTSSSSYDAVKAD